MAWATALSKSPRHHGDNCPKLVISLVSPFVDILSPKTTSSEQEVCRGAAERVCRGAAGRVCRGAAGRREWLECLL